MNKQKTNLSMRVLHRYLGFFLAGIMAVYAISGMVLVFRNTDFLKQVNTYEKEIDQNVAEADLGKALDIRRLKVTGKEGNIIHFENGQYDQSTGKAVYTKEELPYVLRKMTKLHKANTNSPLYFLNLFFGLALLFFVISSFWMFMPQTSVFKKGLYFTAGGIILTLILLFL